jgi:hypothetical protein
MKSVVLWAIAAVLMGGCAPLHVASAPYSAVGVVQKRIVLRARGTDMMDRDVMLGLYGVVGTLMADVMFGVPSHFGYEVRLDDGRTVHVRNTTDVPVGSCVALALRPERLLPDTEFPVGSNEIELSSACRQDGAAQTGR